MNTDSTRRATRSDVAIRAGVSKTTVTFVLGDRYDIAIPETTRLRVKEAARDLGYRPNVVAQALVSGRTQTITVAFPNLLVPHYSRVLQALELQSKSTGHHLIARTVGHADFGYLPTELNEILNSPNDGIILVDLPDTYRDGLEVQQPYGKPVVSMGIMPGLHTDSVELDLTEGATEAVNHLLNSGAQRIAFFGMPWGGPKETLVEGALAAQGDPRAVAYCLGMRAAGRPLEVVLGTGEGRRPNMELLKSYVEAHGHPDALFCYDDEVAVSAHRALRELGIRLPQDVLLVGCDGSVECEYLDPQISTIVQPIHQMSALAWQFLGNRLQDPGVPRQHIKLAARLAERASSRRDLGVMAHPANSTHLIKSHYASTVASFPPAASASPVI